MKAHEIVCSECGGFLVAHWVTRTPVATFELCDGAVYMNRIVMGSAAHDRAPGVVEWSCESCRMVVRTGGLSDLDTPRDAPPYQLALQPLPEDFQKTHIDGSFKSEESK